MLRSVFCSLIFLTSLQVSGQKFKSVETYFQSIRNNTAELTAFFQQMPKGGDLHHHYSGSIYAENYLQTAIDSNYWINTGTLEVRRAAADTSAAWLRFSDIRRLGRLPEFREKLLRRWSVKDYPFQAELPSDQHFFATFDQFGEAKGNFTRENKTAYGEGLIELKRRALSENVQYIETMFSGVRCANLPAISENYNDILLQQQKRRDATAVQDTLEVLHNRLLSAQSRQCVQEYAELLGTLHRDLALDDSSFTIRYQTFCVRVVDPVRVFTRLYLCFLAAEASPLIVGVNIVAPENDPVSMRDYWLHMQMFRFFRKHFPDVGVAMHAGELALGMAPPEELTWHIREAVFTAGAQRIGHGVDIPHEKDCYALLDSMRVRKVAVEINLASNEFILGVKERRHPVLLYRRFGVPIVISTDDAGVLRSNLTEQFVLLAQRYPEFSYAEIKKLVFNSIEFAFMEEYGRKKWILKDIENRFNDFERQLADRVFQAGK
jgi:adenosine deaminase